METDGKNSKAQAQPAIEPGMCAQPGRAATKAMCALGAFACMAASAFALPPVPLPPPTIPCVKPIQQKSADKSSDLGQAVSGIYMSPPSGPIYVPPVACWQYFQSGAIYWTSGAGAHEVHGEIWRRYNNIGGPASWGYPLTDETALTNFSGYGRYNQFQNGRIYYYPDTGAVEMRKLEDVFEAEQAADASCKLGDDPCLRRTLGSRKVLTILINPHVHASDINSAIDPKTDPNEETMPGKDDIEAALFGTKVGVPLASQANSNVRDYYAENSLNQVQLENAGILYYNAPAGKTGKHYWDDSLHSPCSNDGWLSGHEERWADAIKLASNDFDFSRYDANGDKRLTPDELAILVVTPGNTGGDNRFFAGGYNINKTGPCANWTWTTTELTVNGITFGKFAEWFSFAPTLNSPIQLGLPAHELAHLLTGIPDLYMDGKALGALGTSWPFDSGIFSRMGDPCSACNTTHFDPFLKLKAGWLNYTAALGSGIYTLRDAETHDDALVLYDPSRGRNEYFILEYRRPGTSYDAGRGNAGGGLPNGGLAVWHVIEDFNRQEMVRPQPPPVWNYYRRGVLLVRANGGNPVNDATALFTKPNTQLPLTWSDGSPLSVFVTLLDNTNPTGTGLSGPDTIRVLVTTLIANVY